MSQPRQMDKGGSNPRGTVQHTLGGGLNVKMHHEKPRLGSTYPARKRKKQLQLTLMELRKLKLPFVIRILSKSSSCPSSVQGPVAKGPAFAHSNLLHRRL